MNIFKSICIVAVIVCCANIMYADSGPAEKNEQQLKVIPVPMQKVPDYLTSVYYDADGVYVPEVICFNKSISEARMITINKQLVENPLFRNAYCYYKGSFLDDNGENIDKVCITVPLLKRIVKYNRFEFLQYNAKGFLNYISESPCSAVFSVVKDKGKVIWYFEGDAPGDIAVTKDGRYMIASVYSVFYTDCTGSRIISEMYSGNRNYSYAGEAPAEIRILTSNIIRAAYANGLTEHWQVRLTEEDIDKNMKKYETWYSAKEKWNGGNKCLLWSNGKAGAHTSQAMWCYYESGAEPAYKDTDLADITKDIAAGN